MHSIQSPKKQNERKCLDWVYFQIFGRLFFLQNNDFKGKITLTLMFLWGRTEKESFYLSYSQETTDVANVSVNVRESISFPTR